MDGPILTKNQNYVAQTPDQTNTISRIMLESIFIKLTVCFDQPSARPSQPPHCAVYHEKPFSAVDRHIDCSPVTQPIISYVFLSFLFVVLLKRIMIISEKTVKDQKLPGLDNLKKFLLQVNLCKKHFFSHQPTHNMTTDCSLNYDIST